MLHEHDIEIGKALALGPLTLTIAQDDDCENPWESWDCQTPLTVMGPRGGFNTWDNGDNMLDPLADVSDGWTSRHWRALCRILEIDEAREDADAREEARDWVASLGCVRLERFRNALSEAHSETWGGGVDFLEMVSEIWKLRGVPADTFQRNGYSQGDSVYLLLVATPAHAARCGFSLKKPGHDVAESLKRDADLYGAFAFGDCYGYQLGTPDDASAVDSCWGYYGAPWGNNPGKSWDVLDAAKEALRDNLPGLIKEAQADAAKALRDKLELAKEEAAMMTMGAPVYPVDMDAPARWETAKARVAELQNIAQGVA